MSYYDRRPVYRSCVGESRRLYEVVPECVTLRREPRFYWHLIPAWRNDLPEHWMVFEEVSIVEPEETWSEEVRAFVARSECVRRRRVTAEEFAQACFQAMCEAVERAWEPGKFHFVLHSAGWDSRLMSLAMRSLYQDDDVLFVECANEAEGFKQIMQLEGWGESQYIVYNEGAPEEEYHARSLNFETAWERTDGGMRPYPFNMWWDVVEWAQEEGLVPGDDQLQCWSAFTANWVMRSVAGDEGSLGSAFSKIPRNALSAVPLKGEWAFPYVDLTFMETLTGLAQPGWGAYEVVKRVRPELAEIPNPSDVRYRALSGRLCAQAVADYKASWYGRRRPYPAAQEIEYDRWWGHWGLASLCEKLLAEGVEIDQ